MMVNLPGLKKSRPNFLRPTCPYTECWLNFQTGSCPTEIITASYSSCLYLILLACLFCKVLIYSVDAGPYFHKLILLLTECPMHYIMVIRFLFQNPAQSQILLKSSKVWNDVPVFLFLLCYLYCLLCRTFDIRQKFLRIALYPLCQDGINHPQYFTGYHNQRKLHL